MAKYKSKDLLTKTKYELKDRIQFLRKEQFNLRFQAVNGQIENPLRFKLIRREIAAIKTIINNNLMKVK
jgi:large subunit ribosomal protein L29